MTQWRIAVKEQRILSPNFEVWWCLWSFWGAKKIILTRNGFLLRDFFAKQTKFCIVWTGLYCKFPEVKHFSLVLKIPELTFELWSSHVSTLLLCITSLADVFFTSWHNFFPRWKRISRQRYKHNLPKSVTILNKMDLNLVADIHNLRIMRNNESTWDSGFIFDTITRHTYMYLKNQNNHYSMHCNLVWKFGNGNLLSVAQTL